MVLIHMRICTLAVNNDDVNNDDIELCIYKLYMFHVAYSIQDIFLYAVISDVREYLTCKKEIKT